MTDYKPLILMLLGLPETATDADIEAAAKAFAEKSATLNTAAETLGKLDLTKLATLGADFKALTDKFAALETKVSGDEYQAVLNSAAAEGKVIPKALTEGAGRISLEQLKLLTANTPVTVPLDKRTPAHVPVDKITLNSADEENVRKQLGIPKEVWDSAK